MKIKQWRILMQSITHRIWGVFRTQLVKFIRRFWIDPYRKEDTEWIQSLVNENGIRVRSKIEALSKLI